MFCFSDVFFLGPLMYLFDLRGEAARLVYSSTTNVQLKIILLALKSLHLMFKISIMSSKNQNKNKKQTREQKHASDGGNYKEIQRVSSRAETRYKENSIFKIKQRKTQRHSDAVELQVPCAVL